MAQLIPIDEVGKPWTEGGGSPTSQILLLILEYYFLSCPSRSNKKLRLEGHEPYQPCL
ncbi:manganese catalase [Sesbania bispinosa]|nr:manganese catalase [Sesbania bispinosa]